MRVFGTILVALLTLVLASESVCEWVEAADECCESVTCSICLHSVALADRTPRPQPDGGVIDTIAPVILPGASLTTPPLTPPPRA
jgi:hypothetical protein